MEQTEQSSFLGRESLGKLMLKNSVPCVISLLVAALYNIVDQIFIANASYLLNGRFRPFDFVCIAVVIISAYRQLSKPSEQIKEN